MRNEAAAATGAAAAHAADQCCLPSHNPCCSPTSPHLGDRFHPPVKARAGGPKYLPTSRSEQGTERSKCVLGGSLGSAPLDQTLVIRARGGSTTLGRDGFKGGDERKDRERCGGEQGKGEEKRVRGGFCQCSYSGARLPAKGQASLLPRPKSPQCKPRGSPVPHPPQRA